MEAVIDEVYREELSQSSYKKQVRCLTTLSIIAKNLVQNPSDASKRRLSTLNEKLRSSVLDVAGGWTILDLMGFSLSGEGELEVTTAMDQHALEVIWRELQRLLSLTTALQERHREKELERLEQARQRSLEQPTGRSRSGQEYNPLNPSAMADSNKGYKPSGFRRRGG